MVACKQNLFFYVIIPITLKIKCSTLTIKGVMGQHANIVYLDHITFDQVYF